MTRKFPASKVYGFDPKKLTTQYYLWEHINKVTNRWEGRLEIFYLLTQRSRFITLTPEKVRLFKRSMVYMGTRLYVRR